MKRIAIVACLLTFTAFSGCALYERPTVEGGTVLWAIPRILFSAGAASLVSIVPTPGGVEVRGLAGALVVEGGGAIPSDIRLYLLREEQTIDVMAFLPEGPSLVEEASVLANVAINPDGSFTINLGTGFNPAFYNESRSYILTTGLRSEDGDSSSSRGFWKAFVSDDDEPCYAMAAGGGHPFGPLVMNAQRLIGGPGGGGGSGFGDGGP